MKQCNSHFTQWVKTIHGFLFRISDCFKHNLINSLRSFKFFAAKEIIPTAEFRVNPLDNANFGAIERTNRSAAK